MEREREEGGQDTDDRRRPVPAVRLDGKEASPSHLRSFPFSLCPFTSPPLRYGERSEPERGDRREPSEVR